MTLHGTVVALGGRGVLLVGAPGSGKSGLALALIDRGAILVADDRFLLRVCNGALIASAPPALAGLLEVRGVGIVRMPHLAGVPLRLALDLGSVPDRLPPPPSAWESRTFLGVELPILPLDAGEPLAALKVEAALAVLEGR